MEIPPDMQSKIEIAETKVKDAEPILQGLKQTIKETLRKAISDDIEDRRKALQLINNVKHLTTMLFSTYISVKTVDPKRLITVDFLLFDKNNGIYNIVPRMIEIIPTNMIIRGFTIRTLLKHPSVTILLTLIYHIDKIYKEYRELHNETVNNIIEKRIKVSKLAKILEEKIRETLEPLGKDIDEIPG